MKRCQLAFYSERGAQSLDVMLAQSMFERMRGLLARPPLRDDECMLLRACNMVHTVGMGYPIDVVFLRRDGLVLKVKKSLAPWRASGHPRAHCVLELAAGQAARRGIARGMALPIVSAGLP